MNLNNLSKLINKINQQPIAIIDDLTQWQKYYQENKEYCKAYQKEYYWKNRERLRLRRKESRKKALEREPEKIRSQEHEGCKRWRLKHPDRDEERHRKWRISLAGRLNKRKEHLKRRGEFKGGKSTLKDVLNINFLKYGMTLCENCSVACWENYQFDHIVPIFLGGKNEFDNFQILCPAYNKEKYIYAIDFRSHITDKYGDSGY